MADLPISSLTRARELKISELSTHFANDDLSLEELERRIERVYKAATVAELDEITADLRGIAAPSAAAPAGRSASSKGKAVAPLGAELDHSRVLSLMSTTRRVGRWSVPRSLDVVSIMSDTRIDLTSAVIPAGVIDMDLRLVMATFKLIVSPNVRVINQVHSIMADVSSKADEQSAGDVPATLNAPVVRLTGIALLAEVKVLVRRREDPILEDDDDDDND